MFDDSLSSLPRWRATVTYRTEAGPLDVPMVLEEIFDLHDWMQVGCSRRCCGLQQGSNGNKGFCDCSFQSL